MLCCRDALRDNILGELVDHMTCLLGSISVDSTVQLLHFLTGDEFFGGLVKNVVMALDSSALDIDQVENLVKFCPTIEEMTMLKLIVEKMPELLDFDKDLVHLEATSKIQLKSLAEEMQAMNKGLKKVKQELTASENDGDISAGFQK
ncbi:unnamed protein product [Camellia sinensis]